MVLTRKRHARRREAELRAAANQRRAAWLEADAARINAQTERDRLAGQLAAVLRVLAEHECDEACELFNCDETSQYLVSKDRIAAAVGVADTKETNDE